MRCTACNRPFYAALLTDEDGNLHFESICSHCKSTKGNGYSYSFEFFHGISEEPLVRIVKDKSIPTEPY